MKITEVETLLIDEFPNLVYVRIHTDEGLIGLGETFFGTHAVAAWVHETAAPYLPGKNPLQIDRHWQSLTGFVGFNSTGVENRGRSAIDIALWDILGQVCGQPIYQLLGGASRERIRTYNTCAGYRYVRGVPSAGGLPVANWGTNTRQGPYEDLDAFMHRADELALSLLGQGISGMKIWPFDPYAEASGGHYLSAADLKQALEPFRKIREAVGDRMEIMVELHSLWNLPCALQIANALEEYRPFWYEDPVKMDNLEALARFARSTRAPTTASETLGTRWSFRALLEQNAVGIVMFDPAWIGGISESKKVATMAEAYQVPIAPHDCTGQPGVFLRGPAEGAVVSVGLSRSPTWAGVTPGSKVAVIGSTAAEHMSSHLPIAVDGQLLSRLHLSASDPVEVLVRQLNEWQPDLMAGYPSMMRVLAEEQRQGRLHIAPRFLVSASGTLTDDTRRRLEQTWHTRLFNMYATTEGGIMAMECQSHRGLHLFEDLVIVEVVNEDNRPVPPGVYGDKVLLTVLFSRTQPLIRYEVTDRVSLSSRAHCLCGRPFARLEGIEGRALEALHFPPRTGGEVAVHPLVLYRVMESVSASGWQVVQERDGLQVLLSGGQEGPSEETLTRALRQALDGQGAIVPRIQIQRVTAIPRNASGKAPLISSLSEE